MLVFECPSCQGKMQAAEEYAGQTVECPECHARTKIPSRAEPPVKPAPTTEPAPAPTAEAISAAPVVTTASSAPAAKADAITTPEQARSSRTAAGQSRDDDDDRADDRPRRRDSADPAMATGMSVGLIVLLVVGIGFCALVGVGAILAALLVPAVQKVREAAARTQTMNNMKMIALSVHSHHDVHKQFPSPRMQVGLKPPDLSWRVTILPHMEQDVMFKQFDKNSAWDHPNNSPFLNLRPVQYDHVLRPAPNQTQTTFQYFTGPGTMFPEPQSGITLAEITDGASNTFMFAEAQTPVPWSKPADMAVAPNAPLPLPADLFLAAMADGSVRMLDRRRVNDQILRLVIDPRDGQQLPPGWDN